MVVAANEGTNVARSAPQVIFRYPSNELSNRKPCVGQVATPASGPNAPDDNGAFHSPYLVRCGHVMTECRTSSVAGGGPTVVGALRWRQGMTPNRLVAARPLV